MGTVSASTQADYFDRSLISPAVRSALGQDFEIRPLHATDYEKGFLEALSHLTTVGEFTKDKFLDRYAYFKKHNHEYFTIVIEDLKKNRIAAAGTVFVERKFIHEAGLVGHIEDIVSHPGYRGKNMGRYIIEGLKSIAKTMGCYKVILDCGEHNVAFYSKLEFEKKEVEMVWYIKDSKL
ncbi:acyl-CoA N-acyltransferase [Hyaloraphidium curvatum]|nr:acyl-CoA N-acyltransferase [Hyaloraphidium curvatum]